MSDALPETLTASEPILRVEDLKVHFPITKGILFQRKVATVKAVDGVSFTIRRGETLGVPVGNLIRLASEAESRNVSIL